ncbi:MAG TPA: alpha/beta hydrolase [Trueperaceae bacterium]
MSWVTTNDGTAIFYKDWGQGPTVMLSHGWPLNADAWDPQMLFLAQNGYRAVAHDRRGHGRSTQASSGNDMDTYADDLEAVMKALDLTDVVLVGHSTGGGEVAHYVGRHGTRRIRKVVLISAVPPRLLQTESNPQGIPTEVWDGFRKSLFDDRAQFFREFAVVFYGTNRDGSRVSQATLDHFWGLCMQVGLKNVYECIDALSATDFTEDLRRFDVPTLLIHGEDDQVVPIDITARKSARLIPDVREIYYPAAPHGIPTTHQDRVNADLLAFIRDESDVYARERETARADARL